MELKPTEKQMRLRYAGTCRACGLTLPPKTEAIYDRATKTVRCVTHDLAWPGEPILMNVLEGGNAGALLQKHTGCCMTGGSPAAGRTSTTCPSPTGIHVIDAKRYRGRPHLKIEGGLIRPRVERLLVETRDCTRLVDGVLRQVDFVRSLATS